MILVLFYCYEIHLSNDIKTIRIGFIFLEKSSKTFKKHLVVTIRKLAPNIEIKENVKFFSLPDECERVRRLMNDYKEIFKHPVKNAAILPLEGNIFEWTFLIIGPFDSPYSGRISNR
jgi:hypothetical protein